MKMKQVEMLGNPRAPCRLCDLMRSYFFPKGEGTAEPMRARQEEGAGRERLWGSGTCCGVAEEMAGATQG